MSTAVIFDTRAYVKKLRDAGMDARQAEVQADALVSLVEDRLATKQDIIDLKRDIKEMELRMVIKMGAMILASVGMIIGYLRVFPMPVQIVQPLAQETRLPAPAIIPAPPAAPAPTH
ncbi:MAG: CCDC90 family protein [Magnetococcus sp. XQGC-1]